VAAFVPIVGFFLAVMALIAAVWLIRHFIRSGARLLALLGGRGEARGI